MTGIHRSPSSSRALRHEIAPAHEVVGGGAEAKQPVDQSSATVPQFAKQRDGLQPAEGLLNELALAMTEPIPDVSGRARVDGGATVPEFVLGDMRRDVHLSDGGDPGARVV